MLRTLGLAVLLAGIPGSAQAPPQPIIALAPFEVLADGFRSLRGIAVDGQGRTYVADREAGTVTRIDAGAPGVVVARRLDQPVGVAIDPMGRVLVAEERGARVVRLDPTGLMPLVQGVKQPRWLTVGDDGTLYVSARRLTRGTDPEPDDESDEPEMILALAADGTLSVFADGFERLQGLVADRAAVYAATTGLRGVPLERAIVYRIPVLPDGRAGPIVRLNSCDCFERPVGLTLDRLGALFVVAPVANLDGRRSLQTIVKLHPGGTATLFAASLDSPRGLAFDSHGHLYVADGGRVLRFLAPVRPTLSGLPRFTNQTSFPLTGTTVPNARVNVLVEGALSPITAVADAAGAFRVSVPLAPNAETDFDVFSTAARGNGLTSAAAEAAVIHDAVGPALVLQAPAAGGLVHGTVEIRAEAADAASQVATLVLMASGQALSAAVAPPLPAPAATALAAWPTEGIPDGTQTLSASATDQAGNSASVSRVVIVDNTPPETEITGGPGETVAQPIVTFAFAGTDNLAPATSLRFAWRLDGGPSSAFASDTTVTIAGLAPGSHTFEVRARDLAGNEDPSPARRSFTVGALSVFVTAPAAGAVVPAGALLVQGTVSASGTDSGVSVNGRAALVHGSQWAAEIPVSLGVNVVAVVAVAAGAEATASITVTGTEAALPVFLRAEPASGIAPLTVTWRVAGRTPRPLVQFELDETGDGVFGPAQAVLDGTQSIYTTAGLRLPTVRAIDDQGQVYVTRTIVQVDDPHAASARFQALWASFTARLQAGDQAGALAHLSRSLRPRFELVFQQLGPDLPAIAAGLGSIDLIDQLDDLAEAALVQVESGSPLLYFIYFRRDNRGRWLIQEM